MRSSKKDFIEKILNDISFFSEKCHINHLLYPIALGSAVLILGLIMLLSSKETKCVWFFYSSNLNVSVFSNCENTISINTMIKIVKSRIIISIIEMSIMFTLLALILKRKVKYEVFYLRIELLCIGILWFFSHVIMDVISLFIKVDEETRVNSYNIVEVSQILLFVILFSVILHVRSKVQKKAIENPNKEGESLKKSERYLSIPELLKFFLVFIYNYNRTPISEIIQIKYYIKCKILIMKTHKIKNFLKMNIGTFNTSSHNLTLSNYDNFDYSELPETHKKKLKNIIDEYNELCILINSPDVKIIVVEEFLGSNVTEINNVNIYSNGETLRKANRNTLRKTNRTNKNSLRNTNVDYLSMSLDSSSESIDNVDYIETRVTLKQVISKVVFEIEKIKKKIGVSIYNMFLDMISNENFRIKINSIESIIPYISQTDYDEYQENIKIYDSLEYQFTNRNSSRLV